MLVFAEAAPAGLEGWVSNYFYIVGGIFVTVGLIKSLKKKEPSQTVISEQPLHVRAAEEYVPRREFEDLKNEVRVSRAENRMLFAEQTSTTRKDIDGVHTRVTDILAAFRELKGEIKAFMAQAGKNFS